MVLFFHEEKLAVDGVPAPTGGPSFIVALNVAKLPVDCDPGAKKIDLSFVERTCPPSSDCLEKR